MQFFLINNIKNILVSWTGNWRRVL